MDTSMIKNTLRSKICQINSGLVPGNDTIDPYPLINGEIEKILRVSEKIFKEIQKDFRTFLRSINGQPDPSSFNTRPPRGQILGPKATLETFRPKLDQSKNIGHFEPSNTIYLQYSEIRRWRRVNEWFSQYAPYGATE
jgi:hypothetical protein